jgi:hypothetical protein
VSRWALLLATLAACDDGGQSPVGTSLGERIFLETEREWYAHPGNLPPLDLGPPSNCDRLAMFDVLVPPTTEEYVRKCPSNSWACMNWVPVSGKVRTLSYPVAVLSPKMPSSVWADNALHELLHAFNECAKLDSRSHSDARVFVQNWSDEEQGSVEYVVSKKLREPEQ